MVSSRVVEYVFFFGLLGVVAYLVWQIIMPFVSALALAAIIVTICYPLYERIRRVMPWQNEALASLVTTLSVLVILVIPVTFITYSIVSEVTSFAEQFSVDADSDTVQGHIDTLEQRLQELFPAYSESLNVDEIVRAAGEFLQPRIGPLFGGIASTIFLFFIAMIGTFYFFKDGKYFTKTLISISPLPDEEDEIIVRRLSQAVRSVATGTVLIALIQGTLTAIGLSIFGFERAILWGSIASFGALIPSVGTSIVFVPAVIFLASIGDFGRMIGVIIWGMTAVGFIDNLLGPYLMSRGNAMHPFLMLVSVLGGISFFGPIGFIVGPVVVSLLIVLLELYNMHIRVAEREYDHESTTHQSSG